MLSRIHFSILFMLIVIILVVPLGFAACGNDDDNPLSATDTARAMFSAAEENDRDKLADQFCEPSLADLSFPNSDDLRYSFNDLTFTEADPTNERVHVIVSGTAKSNRSDAAPFSWTLDMQQENDHWCVASIMQTPDS